MDRLHFAQANLPDGWAENVLVTVEDGLIRSVEADRPAGDAPRFAAGLPGLVDLHSHAFQRGMAGHSERAGGGADSFWTWREVMYRFLERLSPDDVRAIAAQAQVEMLEGGFTRVAEFHYLHHAPDGRPYDDPAEMAASLAAASDETGIRLTLLPSFYAHGGFGGAAPTPSQRRFVCDRDGFARLLDRSRVAVAALAGATIGLAPHSLRATTPAELRDVAAMLPDGPLHIHVAEQQREVEDCLAWSGRRPVEWLLDNAPVDRRWCLIHATHMTEGETARLAATGATVGWCPVTEANLGDGVFAAQAWRRAGGGWGVGSDSNVCIDAAGELRQAEYSQRLALRARNVLAAGPGASTGRSLFDAASAGGARAAGVAQGLRAGAPADIVALGGACAEACRGDALLDAWIFASPREMVDAVWVGGRRVVSDGRHARRETVLARFRAVLATLLA